ncbi:outer membrane beta-barrel protein [Paracoccus sp. S-4012]|uniref:outer membrane protein n=1 Tax=Paracoccus sp. S-4012 TaxID=2665648 RepID=UPI0012B0A67F|nr:porin family protein [Paracoccus sp. S-4012]MRX49035.1 outer membrane beta-barrel protein [Paracoccus sp. S-4012]
MKYSFASVAAASLFAAGAASAGGYVAPVVEPAPIAPVITPTATVGNWQGGYAGASLGYAFGGDDEFTIATGTDNTEISGVNGGLHVGYRWQRDRWVFGPELSITGGSIDDSVTVGGVDVESSVNHVAALKLKTGYEVQPNTLLYGTAGIARGDFTFTADGTDFDYDANGYVFGIGMERKVTERMSMFGEIERNHFKSENIDLGPLGDTNTSPSFTNVKLGVNFNF